MTSLKMTAKETKHCTMVEIFCSRVNKVVVGCTENTCSMFTSKDAKVFFGLKNMVRILFYLYQVNCSLCY